MAYPSRLLACALVLGVATLAACGSGGDDELEPSGAAEPTAEHTACFPDRATIEQLVISLTPEQAEKIVGCRAYVPPEKLTPGSRMLQWIDIANSDSVLELSFITPGGLYDRAAYFAETEVSSCTPTQAAFDQLPAGVDYAGVVRAFGCDGVLRVDLLGVNSREKRYVWGHYRDNVRPMALVNFKNGVLSFKASARLP